MSPIGGEQLEVFAESKISWTSKLKLAGILRIVVIGP